MDGWETRIVKAYGEEYIFRQLAEEASELCQAALKLVRMLHGETPVTQTQAQEKLIEETADLLVIIGILRKSVLTDDGSRKIDAIQAAKGKRMRERMLEAEDV